MSSPYMGTDPSLMMGSSATEVVCFTEDELFPAQLPHSSWPHALHMMRHWHNSGHSFSFALGSFTKTSVFHYIYSSVSSWQLLCQFFLLLFSDRPLLEKFLTGLYTNFWFISSMFIACGKSGCNIKEQWYICVRALFSPFRKDGVKISRDICLSFGSAL